MISQPANFQTTLWSGVIHAAAREGEAGAARALEELCRRYWRPLFAYARASGAPVADAEDSTQAFFSRLIAQRTLLQRADPARGRFRTVLLTAFKNHLKDEHDHRTRQKRGGGVSVVSLDMNEGLAVMDPGATPEEAYDRQWARDVVSQATAALRAEYVAAGRADWFDLLGSKDGPELSLSEIARRLDSTEAAVKSFSLRMRRKLRLLLERQIADTVATPDDVEQEMTYIAQLLRSGA